MSSVEEIKTAIEQDRLNDILAGHTGQKKNKVAQDTERDYFMDAPEAKEYGIIDQVISRASRDA